MNMERGVNTLVALAVLVQVLDSTKVWGCTSA